KEGVSVYQRRVITRLAPRDRVALLGLDQVEQVGPAGDPVVPDHRPGRAVLEVVPQAATTRRAAPVELEGDADGLGVDVVFAAPPLVAVSLDHAPLDQDVSAHNLFRSRGRDE